MDDQLRWRVALCEMGRRMYARQFCAANEGNLSIRLDEEQFLCTPTMHCKGFLEPDDLCVVDWEGRQLAGRHSRTSEILLHLEIYRRRPDIRAVVHCHPPHATAFAMVHEPVPMGVLPEAEIFLGQVPLAPYRLPGTQEFAESIAAHVHATNAILLANHGTVTYGPTIERAYWLTEILDAYCRTLINARSLGEVRLLTAGERQQLADMRKRWQLGCDPPGA